jgi:hypothetical protein
MALVGIATSVFARDAASQFVVARPSAVEVTLAAAPRASRSAAWAEALPAVDVSSVQTRATTPLRLYTESGALDPSARTRFEDIAAAEGPAHELAPRLEQLVFKAAYHFGGSRAPAHVIIVSGYRNRAGRHTSGEALDFKLVGVGAAQLAAFLRSLPRVGVGIYTHPRTQYVHLDVRDTSYHWLDASPPGVSWKERQLRDPGQAKRDAAWTPEADLPLP